MAGLEVLSYRDTILVVKDFLETAFHTILYLRQIYPPELFSQKQKYKIPVWQSRNPALNEYLGKIVESIGEALTKGTLKKVAFVVKEANLEQKALERFVFDLKWLIDGDELSFGADFKPRENGITRAEVEDALRAFLLKLNTADSYLLSLPPETTFAIIIELKENSPAPESKAEKNQLVPVEWVPADERHAPGEKGSLDERSSITPLKSNTLGLVNLELLVEELSGKFELVQKRATGETASMEQDHREDDNQRKGKGRAS